MQHRRGSGIVGGALLAVVLAGCAQQNPPDGDPPAGPTSPEPVAPIAEAPDCAAVASRTVDALQRYVDGFAGVAPEQLTGAATDRQLELDETAAALRARAGDLGCATDEIQDLLAAELERLEGDGAVAESVAATLRAGLLDTEDPSDRGPVDTTVRQAGELVSVVANAGTGSTITLAPGEYVLDQPLVLLRPITIVGDPDGGSVIRSSAEGVAVLSLTDGDLELRDVAIEHTGDAPASVVVVRTGGYRFERITVSGARTDADGTAGVGILLRPEDGDDGDVREILDSELVDNEAGGIIVGGQEQPTIRRLTVRGTARCGVCYVEEGGGELAHVDVRDHAVGVRVDDDAAPTIRDTHVEGNDVGIAFTGTGDPHVHDTVAVANGTGIEIAGSGAPTLERNELRDNAEVGLRLGGQTRAEATGTRVLGASDVGVVVLDQAGPRLDGGEVRTSGEAGAVFTDAAGGRIHGFTIAGPRIGIQLEGDATPRVETLVVEAVGDAAVVVTGQAGGTLDTLRCAGAGGLVVLLEQAAPQLGEGIDCEVADQRA